MVPAAERDEAQARRGGLAVGRRQWRFGRDGAPEREGATAVTVATDGGEFAGADEDREARTGARREDAPARGQRVLAVVAIGVHDICDFYFEAARFEVRGGELVERVPDALATAREADERDAKVE